MSEKEIREAVFERLKEVERDRDIIKRRIRRTKDRRAIKGLRKLNNLLERTERALDSEL